MATMNQLMTALRSADAAGATDDAQRIAQIIASQQRSGPRDSAFGYSIDWAQQMLGKGVEVIGDLVGSKHLHLLPTLGNVCTYRKS